MRIPCYNKQDRSVRTAEKAGKGMEPEKQTRTPVAMKRRAQKQDLVSGVILLALAAAAAVSAALNAADGAGFIAVGAAACAVAAFFGGYCLVRFFAQKKLPETLVYAEGGSLFCYRYKNKEYVRIPLAEVTFAEGGRTVRDVRAGLLRIGTAQGTLEIVEVADPFAAKEAIAGLKAEAAAASAHD